MQPKKNGVPQLPRRLRKKQKGAAKGFTHIRATYSQTGRTRIERQRDRLLTEACRKAGHWNAQDAGRKQQVAYREEHWWALHERENIKKLSILTQDALKCVSTRMLKRQSLNVQGLSSSNGHPSARYGVLQLPTRNLVNGSGVSTVNLSEADVKESNGVIRYMDVNAETRNAAGNCWKNPEAGICGSAWIERSATLQVIPDTIPVTKQAYRSLFGFSSRWNRSPVAQKPRTRRG